MVAEHTRDDTMSGIASRILRNAPPQFILVGLSMGGYIAFEIMREAPERVIKLILMDTSARSDTSEQSERRSTLISRAQNGQLEQIADQLFPVLVHPLRKNDPKLKNLVRLMAAEVGPNAFVRQQNAIISRPDSRSGLGAIKCPTLIVVGDHDELTPPELSEEIADGLSGAHLIKIPECGHLSTLEKPDKVSQAIVNWIQS
ncbi:alpha/beta fold hydrolase [Desulfatitalea tepidiphila]|uniref:alpha/beta fold hydrolase n=1 Tax=Desulfatitalea tepidiphila TaxID=1185843 RepID=UPI00190FFB45|nr:alpha/beta fold hydrolase [Desulfatitalea tepidiphila]